jgi:hypothetical protein
VAVAQPVVDQADKLAGGGDHADVAAAARGDPVADPSQPGLRADALDRFHPRPAGQPGALPGDRAAVHVGVGLVMAGRQPRPAGQLGGAGKRVTSPISATSTKARTGPSPSIARIAR